MRLLRNLILSLLCCTPAFAQSPSLFGVPYSSDPACGAGEYWIAVNSSLTAWRQCANGSITTIGAGGGGGEANTHSSVGGGLAITAATPKVGVDLRLVSLAAADFDSAADVITIDATKWLTITAGNAAYQPLDADLTSIAALVTTAYGRDFLTRADAAAARTYIGAVIGTNVQAWDADLDDLADGILTAGKVGGTTANRCVRTDGSGNLIVASGDCPSGDTTGGGSFSGGSVDTTIAVTSKGMYFTATVTGQTWVTTSSEIICNPFGTTADSLTPETVAVSNPRVTVSDRVAGTGFTIHVANPYGLEGTLRVHCVGI